MKNCSRLLVNSGLHLRTYETTVLEDIFPFLFRISQKNKRKERKYKGRFLGLWIRFWISCLIVQFRVRDDRWIKEVKTHFFTGLASIWSNIFTNSSEKKTCLLLCLLCIFKFQKLTCQNCWIFYFMSRLTLYECVVNVCIQWSFLIRNWTTVNLKSTLQNLNPHCGFRFWNVGKFPKRMHPNQAVFCVFTHHFPPTNVLRSDRTNRPSPSCLNQVSASKQG